MKGLFRILAAALCLTAVITLCGCFSDPVYRYKESVDGVISVQILRVGESEEILADNVDAGILSELQGLKLRRYLNSPEAEDHFGLKSVYNRLFLYYNNKCKFRIFSQKDTGTAVVICIPKNWEEL